MKKVFSLIIVLITVCACGEDLKRNDASVFQSVKNNAVWIGGDAQATISTTTLTVQAVSLTERVVLQVPIPSAPIDPGNTSSFITHVLGVSSGENATYSVTGIDGEVVFETGTKGDGEIVITEYNGGTVSGTFRFNAVNTDEESNDSIVNFQKGVFYKINVTPAL